MSSGPRASTWSSLRAFQPATRCAIFLRGDRKCAWCRRKLTKALLQIDHVVPRCDGGSDRPDNLVPACSGCNAARSGSDECLAERLAEVGLTLAEARREVRRQQRAPLDRAAGRKLAARWYPWGAVRAERDGERRKERRARAKASALAGDGFPFGALAEGEAA